MWALLLFGLCWIQAPPAANLDTWTTLLYTNSQSFDPKVIHAETTDALRQDFQREKSIPPRPVERIFYEGLLNNDPRRMQTEEHLRDMDRLALFYWYHKLQDTQEVALPMRKLALAWVSTYRPDGNPINENKLVPLVYVYPLLSPHLNEEEDTMYRDFLSHLAQRVMNFPKTPMNNWETKRIHLLGVTGMVLGRGDYIDWAESRFRNYVDQCLFPDGTSSDIRQRDALSYHVSALKPLCQLLVYMEAKQSGRGAEWFFYTGHSGGSLQKSLKYVLPYAKGEAVYAQWNNSTVTLDKQRAEAGLAEYQPGVVYQADRAYDTMAMASLFDSSLGLTECQQIVCQVVLQNPFR